jgi:prevent-host-death family protein
MNNRKMEPEVETAGAFEARTCLSRILREAQSGKHFIITQRGKPVAEIHPPAGAKRPSPRRGDMKGKIWMADDFCALCPTSKDISPENHALSP